MKLREFEGKELLKKYGIAIPHGALFSSALGKLPLRGPVVVKAQTLSGDRKKAGGVLFAENQNEASRCAKKLFGRIISGEKTEKILVEEKIDCVSEYYVSLSYGTDDRAPVLSVSPRGGSGIARATVAPIDMALGLTGFFVRATLLRAGFSFSDVAGLSAVIENLWRLFISESALLAEVNPLFRTKDGNFIAGDAKIIIDDAKNVTTERRFIDLGGDIAILASGGGASLLNIDVLLDCGGRPANYTEYSGNPPAEVVTALTKKVLKRPGLRGAWVVGGTANFTDIYETIRGFIDGLREINPKPSYPIVIRRDGPRQKEAFEMLREVGKKERYDFHLFDSSVSMANSAKKIVELAYKKKRF